MPKNVAGASSSADQHNHEHDLRVAGASSSADQHNHEHDLRVAGASSSSAPEPREQDAPATPRLRFPEFRDTGEWEEIELGKKITIKGRIGYRGYTVNDIVNPGEGAISLSPSNINDSALLEFDKSTYISWAKYHESPEIKVAPGHTLLVKTGSTFGKVAYVSDLPHECTVNPQIVVLKPDSIDSYFLYLLVSSEVIQTKIRAIVVGGAIPTLSQESVSKFQIRIPTLAEQQRIADCLSSLDALIAAQARKVDALKSHKKGLMQQLFPRDGETQPRLRFPEFQDAGEWEMGELGSLSDIRDGTHDSPSFFTTGRPLVTSKNLRPDGTLDLKNISLISEDDYQQINKRSKVSVGDILFGMIGTIGNPVLIQSEGFAIKNVALIKETGSLLNAFVVQLLKSEYVAAIFAMLNTGNSQKFIALGKIRDLPVPVPSLAEQQRIADCLSSLDDLITAATHQLATLKTHKQGLMQQLFPNVEEIES